MWCIRNDLLHCTYVVVIVINDLRTIGTQHRAVHGRVPVEGEWRGFDDERHDARYEAQLLHAALESQQLVTLYVVIVRELRHLQGLSHAPRHQPVHPSERHYSSSTCVWLLEHWWAITASGAWGNVRDTTGLHLIRWFDVGHPDKIFLRDSPSRARPRHWREIETHFLRQSADCGSRKWKSSRLPPICMCYISRRRRAQMSYELFIEWIGMYRTLPVW